MLYFIKPENKYPISEFQHNLNPESNIRNPNHTIIFMTL